jgi:hypothetical protein
MPDSMSFDLDARKVKIDRRFIYRTLGYPSPKAVTPMVRDRLPALIHQARRVATPRALVRVEEIARTGPRSVRLRAGPVFGGRLLAEAFAPASHAALFVLTIGDAISRRVSGLSENALLEGFVLDSAASALVESLANSLPDLAAGLEPLRGLFPGLRFSPGYCDWSITEMPALLSRIGARQIGISLTGGGMMFPEKSICGMIGFGPDPVAMQVVPCRNCPETTCAHRRASSAVSIAGWIKGRNSAPENMKEIEKGRGARQSI